MWKLRLCMGGSSPKKNKKGKIRQSLIPSAGEEKQTQAPAWPGPWKSKYAVKNSGFGVPVKMGA